MDFIVSHWEVWFSAIPPVLTLWLLKTISSLVKKQQIEKKKEHEAQEHLKQVREMEKRNLEIQRKNIDDLMEDKVDLENEIENFRNILIALAHDRLYQSCNFFIERTYITSSELNNLEFLYKAYDAIGGNGTGTDLYNKCRRLEIKPTMVD